MRLVITRLQAEIFDHISFFYFFIYIFNNVPSPLVNITDTTIAIVQLNTRVAHISYALQSLDQIFQLRGNLGWRTLNQISMARNDPSDR